LKNVTRSIICNIWSYFLFNFLLLYINYMNNVLHCNFLVHIYDVLWLYSLLILPFLVPSQTSSWSLSSSQIVPIPHSCLFKKNIDIMCKNNMWYLSFWIWFTLFKMIFNSIHSSSLWLNPSSTYHQNQYFHSYREKVSSGNILVTQCKCWPSVSAIQNKTGRKCSDESLELI
jgi:hypothetical protein